MPLPTVENGRTALRFEAVTPSNSTPFPGGRCSALFIGVGGDVTILNSDGTAVTFKNLANGSYLDCKTTRVNATGTTATDIVALY
jgi:hypothetical protein